MEKREFKAKGGRPKSKISNLKIEEISLRLTHSEKEKLKSMAKISRESMSGVISNFINNNELPKAKRHIGDDKLFAELNRIGSNINQITRIYNRLNSVLFDEEKYKIFEELNVKLDDILNRFNQ